MANHGYSNFDLSIEQDGDHYRARVLQSCAGEGVVEFELPFSATELENFILKIGHARRGNWRGGHGSDNSEAAAAKEFGGKLFGAVFQGDVYARLLASLEEARAEKQGLRVLLRISPELADLPWEYLYNPAWNQFFSLSVDTPLVRYFELTPALPPLEVTLPLRMLVMISSPSDYAPLDVEREWRDLQAALQPLVARGLVEIDRLEGASPLALQRQLWRNEYHIFHFIGHGSFDERHQDGLLILSDEHGRGLPLSGQDLGTLLHNHPSLRLALLNACEGARAGSDDPFAGVAHSLVQMGLPAVIAMQFEISDTAAILFAQVFYAALADGYGVDAALTHARTAIFASGGSVEWGTPVLFTRTPDGQIFDLTSAPTPAPLVVPEPAAKQSPLPERDAPLLSQQVRGKMAPHRSDRGGGQRLAWLSTDRRWIAVVGLVLIGLGGVIFAWARLAPGMSPALTASVTPGLSPSITSQWVLNPSPSMMPSLPPSATPSLTPTGTPKVTPTITFTATLISPPGMAFIPAGPFQMGSNQYDNEKPVHTVTVNAFWIDKYEVTNADYAKCVTAGKCQEPVNKDSSTRKGYYDDSQYANYPMLNVSWSEAANYCKNMRAGGRLPTEAEWEKAARGGLEGKLYSWGDTAPVCTAGAENGAQFNSCTHKDTVAVGSFKANGYGLYDMTGNAWEWTTDWYSESYYQSSPDQDPSGPQSGSFRVARGGSWSNSPASVRVAGRIKVAPDLSRSFYGFRCAVTLKSPE